MSSFRESILEAIGETPLVRLNRVVLDLPGELYAKCEFLNPGGSIKDRIGKHMVEVAEKKGLIKPGGTIIEATSGNTGMGLAIAAAIKGYQTIFVMPDKMSEEKRQNLRAFGAKVVITPTGVSPDSPHSHYSVAARLERETPNSLFINQYSNLANRDTHYLMTGPEIWEQTKGKFDAIVIGMGTCGTISGLGKFIKEKNPKIKVVGVDPKGSILKDLFEKGTAGQANTYKIEGIGEDLKPLNCDFSVVDEIIRVEDKESFLMTRALLVKEGIFSGSSSGAAVVGALRYLSKTKNPGRVIVILPDSGNRYLSKVYNDAWMIENSFMEKKVNAILSDLIRVLHKSPKVVMAKPTDTLEQVVKLMRDNGVSQLPVFRDTELLGVIGESDLFHPLFSGSVKSTDAIQDLIQTQYSIVQEGDEISRLNEIFTGGKVALVSVGGNIQHVLTKIDLISYLSLRPGGV